MHFLLADIQIDECYCKNNYKQNQCRCSSLALVVWQLTGNVVVDVADHGVEPALVADGSHCFAEYTHNVGIFLESADEAGDDDVGNQRGKKGNGNAGEGAELTRSVNFRSVVVLLIDALQAAQQNEDFEGQCVPHDVDHQHENVCPIGRTGINPVDFRSAEEFYNVVNDAGGVHHFVFASQETSRDVEHCCEHHADSDGVGNVGKEVDGLQNSSQRTDGVENHRNEQRQNCGDGNGQYAQQKSVFHCREESAPFNNTFEVFDAESEFLTACCGQHSVSVGKRHVQGVDDWINRKYQQQYYCGRKVQPCFPMLFRFYHIAIPLYLLQSSFPFPC